MKRNSTLILLCTWSSLALAGLPTSSAADSSASGASSRQSATITGQISNAATAAYLEGARIQVRETGRQTLADREGRYAMVTPAGSVTVLVSYTGLTSQTFALTLMDGQKLVQNVGLTSEIYKMFLSLQTIDCEKFSKYSLVLIFIKFEPIFSN